MKRIILIISLLLITSCCMGSPPTGALLGFNPASDTWSLLTVATPTAEVPAWPMWAPKGAAFGFHPASGTYHPLIVDELGRLAVDAGGSSLWTDNGDSISSSETVIIAADFELNENDDNTVGSSFRFNTSTGFLDYYLNNGFLGRLGGSSAIWSNLQANNAFKLSTHVFSQLRSPWVAVQGSVGGTYTGLGLYADDADASPKCAVTATGLLIDTTVDDGVNSLQNNGFSRLGDSATGLKMKLLTGTTGANEGDIVQIAHGLTSSKIVSFSSVVMYNATNGVSENFVNSTELEYSIYFDGTNFNVLNSGTNSGSMLSKDISITVWYIN